MSALCWLSSLLAAENPLTYMGRNFREGGQRYAFGQLAVLAAVLVGLGVGLWLLVRLFNCGDRVGYHKPRKLFSELCRAHRLDRRDRRFLRKLARAHQMKQPGRLFLEPEAFAPAACHAISQAEREALDRLYGKLFGESLDGDS